MGKPDQVKVRFFMDNGQIKGRIVEDLSGQGRRKLALIDRTNIGPLPKPDDESLVDVVKDTRPDDCSRGVLFVSLPKQIWRVRYAPHPWVGACQRLGLDYGAVMLELDKLFADAYLDDKGYPKYSPEAEDLYREFVRRFNSASDPAELVAHSAWQKELDRVCSPLFDKHRELYNGQANDASGKVYDLLDKIPRWVVSDVEEMIARSHPQSQELQKILPKLRQTLMLHEIPLLKNRQPSLVPIPPEKADTEEAYTHLVAEVDKLKEWIREVKALETELRQFIDLLFPLLGRTSLKEQAEEEGRWKQFVHEEERKSLHERDPYHQSLLHAEKREKRR